MMRLDKSPLDQPPLDRCEEQLALVWRDLGSPILSIIGRTLTSQPNSPTPVPAQYAVHAVGRDARLGGPCPALRTRDLAGAACCCTSPALLCLAAPDAAPHNLLLLAMPFNPLISAPAPSASP